MFTWSYKDSRFSHFAFQNWISVIGPGLFPFSSSSAESLLRTSSIWDHKLYLDTLHPWLAVPGMPTWRQWPQYCSWEEYQPPSHQTPGLSSPPHQCSRLPVEREEEFCPWCVLLSGKLLWPARASVSWCLENLVRFQLRVFNKSTVGHTFGELFHIFFIIEYGNQHLLHPGT